MTDTYVDVAGSSITITPTTSTSSLDYEYSCMMSYGGTGTALVHFKLFRDGVEITSARCSSSSATGVDTRVTLFHSIPNSSTSSTTFKLQARRFGSAYPAKLHETYFFDGSASNQDSSASVSIREILA